MAGEVEEGAWGDVSFLQLVQEAWGGAEVGDALGGKEGEEGVRAGVQGRAVVEDAAAAEEADLDGDEVHDPACLFCFFMY